MQALQTFPSGERQCENGSRPAAAKSPSRTLNLFSLEKFTSFDAATSS